MNKKDDTQDVINQLAALSREQRRTIYLRNKKKIGVSWDEWNALLRKRRLEMQSK